MFWQILGQGFVSWLFAEIRRFRSQPIRIDMFHVPNKYRLRTHPTLGSDESYHNNGFFVLPWRGYEIRCQASDGEGWEHVSVTINRDRIPNWEIMCFVKETFWDEEDTVVQFHPPKSQYVNCHPNCLHLWRPTEVTLPVPDPILVGPKCNTRS